MAPKKLDYLPKILAYIPCTVRDEDPCPCGSLQSYYYCCSKILRTGRYNSQILAYEELFPARRRSYYLITCEEGDIT